MFVNGCLSDLRMKGLHSERLLIVEGNGSWASLLMDVVAFQGVATTRVSTFREGSAHLRQQFGLIFMEVRIGRERCFSFIKEIVTRGGNGPIVAISGSAPLRDIFLLPEYGVRHFIEYPVSRNKLKCVLEALDPNGESYENCPKLDFYAKISAMEQATLDCMLRGMTCRGIAAFRGVSTNTIKTQIRSILTKMGVSSQKELMSRMLPADTRR